MYVYKPPSKHPPLNLPVPAISRAPGASCRCLGRENASARPRASPPPAVALRLLGRGSEITTDTRLPTHAHVRLQQNSLWPRPTPSSSLVKFQQDEINAFANISVVLLPPFPSCSYLRSSRLLAVVSPDYLPTSITSCSYYCSPRATPRSLHHFLLVIVINSYVFLLCFCACSYHRSLRAATIVDSALVLP